MVKAIGFSLIDRGFQLQPSYIFSFSFPKRNKKLNKNVMNWRRRILPTVQQKSTNFSIYGTKDISWPVFCGFLPSELLSPFLDEISIFCATKAILQLIFEIEMPINITAYYNYIDNQWHLKIPFGWNVALCRLSKEKYTLYY